MNMFSNIEIIGFRRLYEINVELRPLTVVTGQIGAGKTSFLDLLDLLSASAEGTLKSKIKGYGGINNFLSFDAVQRLSVEMDMTVPGGYEPLKYHLTTVPKGSNYSIEIESLSQRRIPDRSPFKHIDSYFDDVKFYEIEQGRLVRPTWDYNSYETSLSQVPKMYKQPEEFRKMLASSVFYRGLDTGPRAPVRYPQSMKPAASPGENGEDLVSCLFNMRETDRDRFAEVEEMLQRTFPEFERLDFPPVAAGMLAMSWKERNIPRSIHMNRLSDGKLKFLWLTALLFSPSLTAITMIDEPENGLSPRLIRALADMIRDASRETQVIMTTHSDLLLRHFEPEEVVIMDIDDEGKATATWAEELDYDLWLKNYHSGECNKTVKLSEATPRESGMFM